MPAPVIQPHLHPVVIYYEDTDFSGVVYHANYLRFFERAREHFLGIDELKRLYRDEGIGFVVYKLEMSFREPARHGDRLEVRSRARAASPYRIVFDHGLWRQDGDKAMVAASIQLACIDGRARIVRIPASVLPLIEPAIALR